jgi:hypothetical protein
MKQVFYHYTLWEDFQARMYDEDKEGRPERIQKAIQCLTDPAICYEYMTKVVKNWKYATEQNFTNKSINHQAFLGQCACCLFGGVHEDETREAWGKLTNEQRYKANSIADRVYSEWLVDYEKTNEPYYQTSLFD